MELNNRVESCYMRQAQFSSGLSPKDKGLRVNGEALQLFDNLPNEASKLFYVNSLDTNGDGFLSLKELAAAYQRADKNGNQERNEWGGISLRDNGKTTKDEVLNDFALHGAGPYLLREAKKVNPEKYAQVEQRLKSGTFTVTGEYNDNLLKKPLSGNRLGKQITEAVREYENLERVFPEERKSFFNKLAEGEAVGLVNPFPKKNVSFPITLENLAQKDNASDPITKKIAQKLCEEVFTQEKVKNYSNNVLDAVKNPQKLSAFLTTIGNDINKTLALSTTTTVKNKQSIELGKYTWSSDKISTFYPKIKEKEESLTKNNTPEPIKRQELLSFVLSKIVSHEYMHAVQNDVSHKPPSNLSFRELMIRDAWIQNRNYGNYYTCNDITNCDYNRYAKQPLEKSALNLEKDVEQHLKYLFAEEKRLEALAQNSRQAK